MSASLALQCVWGAALGIEMVIFCMVAWRWRRGTRMPHRWLPILVVCWAVAMGAAVLRARFP